MLSVITSISFDHQMHLGDRLEQIAFEKAGILRSSVPAVLWTDPEPAGASLLDRAYDLGSPVIDATLLSSGFALQNSEASAPGHRVCEVTTPSGYYRLELPLAGEHQLRNLRIAVLAAEQLAALGFDRIDRTAIERGVVRCRWPGRLERVDLELIDDSNSEAEGGSRPVTFLLDGAHNEGAALALASYLDHLGEPFDLLFGCLERKEVEKILPHLARRARRVVLTAPQGGVAHPPDELRALLSELDLEVPVAVRELPEDALAEILSPYEQAQPGEDLPRLILACGSLYLVGNLRPLLYRRFGVPLPAAELSLLSPR